MERGARQAVCPQCSAIFDVLVLAAKNDHPRPPPSFDDGARSLYPMAWAVVGLTVLAILAAIALAFINRATSRRELARFQTRQTHVAEVIPRELPAPPSLVWFEPEAPVPLPLPDGGEGLVGLVIRAAASGSQLELDAFDGALAPLWRDGPLGRGADGPLAFHVASDGQSVVLTDARPTLRVYEGQTGAPRFALPLSVAARQLCPAGPGRFELLLADGARWLLDVEKQHLTPGTLDACSPPPTGGACAALLARSRLHAQCVEPGALQPPAGVTAAYALREGELTVLVGREARSAATVLVGYRAGALRWRQTLPFTDAQLAPRQPLRVELGAGSLLVKAAMREAPFHPRLRVYDPESGALRFDRELPREEHAQAPSLMLTPTRIAVPTAGALFVLDAQSGALRGQLGD